MADNIGPKIQIEGEAEFKRAIADINRNLRTLGTEMKAVTSAYERNDKSAENLTAQNAVLNKQIDAQKNKLDELKAMLDKSKAAYGENDAQTQKYQQQVNLATASLNRMERELKSNEAALDGMEKGLGDAGNAAEESSPKFEKLGGVLKGAATAAAAVATAAAAAAAKLGKEVLSAFGDYEQLVGGVDTLFGDSSQKLQEYAANAYKTAGVSANEYMETVTSFSASLLQSLGGDTEAAVKYADMAMVDMADNANKMGTDMASIQNAYQGFAKQNYTMLDNLKLGYGGTKSEMERLLADASEIAGVKFDISSYADVVEAIHVMQESMDIAGTTALEAEETIQGSIASMGAAWHNLLVGFGNADADVSALTGMLVDSFQTVMKNVIPVIENMTAALPQAIGAILPEIGKLLPLLLETATSLFRQVLDAVLEMFPQLIPVAVEALMTVVDALIDNLPLIINGALMLVLALAEGVIDALPELIPAIVDTVTTIVDTLIENIDMLIDASIAIIIALAEGLIMALPQLIEKVPIIINKLVEAIVFNLPKILAMGVRLIAELGMGIISAIPMLVAKIPEVIAAIVGGFQDGIVHIIEVGKDIVRGLWEGIKSMGKWLKDKVSDFFGGVVDGVKGFLGIRSPSRVFAGIGKNMAAGLGVGFTDQMRSVARQINDAMPVPTGNFAFAGAGIGGGITINQTNHFGDTYKPRDGAAAVRDLNRQLGRLYV